MARRRRAQQLERVLGTNALFATAYGNVGSSIYYALGVVAVYALGLTPVVFIVAGLIFACTAATYAEGTVRYPEAGGSSSFARHAFNELVSFEAAWAQMLNYIATIAVSAFFVPHYLSVFWAPLKQNPWDVVVGIGVIVLLVLLNVVGVQESAKVNVLLAVVDFATQLLLVALGVVLVFSPHILATNIHLGVAPTWGQLFLSIPVAMLAYTGIETVSNMSEEARDPVRTIPRAVLFVAIAVFAIYFTLPWVALSAMPVVHTAQHGFTTLLALPPTESLGSQHGYQNDPVLGLVNNLGIGPAVTHALQIYLGVLAATILLIGANAGVIGASRITYAMSGYRQLPLVFRTIHPRFKTPWLALAFFAGAIPILLTLSGQTSFLGAIYSFGATFSFTVAHAAVIRLRMKHRDRDEVAFAAPLNLRWRGVRWPLFAVIGGLGTGLSWLVIVIQTPAIRYAGLGWLLVGLAFYVVYRRRVVQAPLTETVRAPVQIGPAAALEYRHILVPVAPGYPSDEAMDVACRLAAERRAVIVAVTVIEVPLELPLDALLPDEVQVANEQLDEARAIGEAYGVRVIPRILRARSAGRAIVDEAVRRGSEIVVMGGPRRRRLAARRRPIFGDTVDFVLKHAPCRVMVAAREAAAA
ncbi:MAG: universal stress protein [Thermoleophilia bacterium]|nr:universal stress protein [Thermoleophilia bacterium]